MIRVGIVLNSDSSEWTGGSNYYAGLLYSMQRAPRIEPVILTGKYPPASVSGEAAGVEIVQSRLIDPAQRWMLARRTAEKLYGRAFALEQLLRSLKIDVLSHSGQMGPRSHFPTIGWIPDFQHVRLPEFFSAKERKARAGVFTRLADYCTRVVVSSEDARRDFIEFRPRAAEKVRVLQFVPRFIDALDNGEPRESLLARYGIEGPYFHLPNQFWAHKNHAVVVEALQSARAKGRRMSVVATGQTSDYRNPEHFKRLMKNLAESDCAEDFSILGLVPSADLVGLMRHSVAVINPSLFEGWSTTVEESKCLGKTIILSDIPVHREQNPDYGHFFNPRAPEQLAGLMIAVLDGHDREREATQAAKARGDLPRRLAAVAETYERIVLEAAGVTAR